MHTSKSKNPIHAGSLPIKSVYYRSLILPVILDDIKSLYPKSIHKYGNDGLLRVKLYGTQYFKALL